MKVLNTVGKIEGTKITFLLNNTSYNIYDIAFIELQYEEIKIRNYIFLPFFIFNYSIYLTCSKDVFLAFFGVSSALYLFSFSLNLNLKKYYLKVSFKNFKNIKIPIKSKELSNATTLIEEYKKTYMKIDSMPL